MKFILLANLLHVPYTVQTNACNIYGVGHSANVTAKLLWSAVLNCAGMECNRIAGKVSCVRAHFVAAVLDHILCTRRKGGFTDGCKYEFGYHPGVWL